MLKRSYLAAFTLLGLGTIALSADDEFATPTGLRVQGVQIMCQNGSNKAVPCSSAVPLPTSGGGGGGGDATAANQVTGNNSLSVIDDWDDGADSATVVRKPTAGSAYGLTPVVTATAASSKVIKASAGNFYGFNGTSGASAGYFLVYDLTAAPSNGTVTPVDCISIPATTTVGVSYDPPIVMAAGATVAFSTTGCFTQTLSVTAFISGVAK